MRSIRWRLEVALRVGLQVQDDHGAAGHALGLVGAGWRDLEAGAAGGPPDPGLAGAGTTARHLDAVGDHEGGIEADAELADQAGAVLGLGEPAHERARARSRDGAELVDQLLAGHADAGVGDGQGAGRLVGRDADGEGRAVGHQLRLGDGFVAQLVAGVGRVRDQLAQEDVALRVDRVHHEAQQLGHLGLEGMGFGNLVAFSAHASSLVVSKCRSTARPRGCLRLARQKIV